MKNYILENKVPIAVADIVKWAEWFETADRHVAKEDIGDVRVSTVFLGLDHQFENGPPILFETMVFGGVLDQEMERYCTWEEAEAGHNEIVKKVREVEDA